MLFKKTGFPSKNELIICSVKKVLPHCAFVKLNEYQDREGMLHISEVAHRVKKIKDYIKLNKTLVCKVLRTNPEKNHIDVSLRRVKKYEERNKLNEWKKSHRLESIFRAAAEKAGCSEKDILNLEEQIFDKYESMHEFFDIYLESDSKLLDEFEIPEKFRKNLSVFLKELKKKKIISLKKTINAVCYEGDGVLRIKNLLSNLKNKIENYGAETVIRYLGSSRYLIKMQTDDVKKMEKSLRLAFENTEKEAKTQKVMFQFEKKK